MTVAIIFLGGRRGRGGGGGGVGGYTQLIGGGIFIP